MCHVEIIYISSQFLLFLNMPDQPHIQETRDGSTTLYSPQFSQTYHNRAGAVTESRHVFFETPGVPEKLDNNEDINILEIGFGTGLNLVLLLDYLQKIGSSSVVTFTSVEAFPISPKTAEELDFGKELEQLDYKPILKNIFSSLKNGWNRFEISPHVTLNIFSGTFEDLQQDDENLHDFIFHDPFSPEANPEGWTPELFKKIAGWCKPDALLATYCAASKARASMAAAGWKVARAPGAPGKREMTLASLVVEKLKGLKRVNEKRLIKRFGLTPCPPLYQDREGEL